MTGRFEFGHGRNELHNRHGHISNCLLLVLVPTHTDVEFAWSSAVICGF
jgi:hypothetical protein